MLLVWLSPTGQWWIVRFSLINLGCSRDRVASVLFYRWYQLFLGFLTPSTHSFYVSLLRMISQSFHFKNINTVGGVTSSWIHDDIRRGWNGCFRCSFRKKKKQWKEFRLHPPIKRKSVQTLLHAVDQHYYWIRFKKVSRVLQTNP